MKSLIQSIAGLCVAFSLAGCRYSPGYVDSHNGVMYGGGYVPCNIPDPFGLIFGCGGCGGWGGGWGTCGVSPCTPACGTAPCVDSYSGAIPVPLVGSYSGTMIPTPVIGGYNGTVIPTPVIESYTPAVVPSVPAGVFQQAAPAATAAPLPSTPTHTGSIIYQTRPSSGRQHPTQDARNQRWVPARL